MVPSYLVQRVFLLYERRRSGRIENRRAGSGGLNHFGLFNLHQFLGAFILGLRLLDRDRVLGCLVFLVLSGLGLVTIAVRVMFLSATLVDRIIRPVTKRRHQVVQSFRWILDPRRVDVVHRERRLSQRQLLLVHGLYVPASGLPVLCVLSGLARVLIRVNRLTGRRVERIFRAIKTKTISHNRLWSRYNHAAFTSHSPNTTMNLTYVRTITILLINVLTSETLTNLTGKRRVTGGVAWATQVTSSLRHTHSLQSLKIILCMVHQHCNIRYSLGPARIGRAELLDRLRRYGSSRIVRAAAVRARRVVSRLRRLGERHWRWRAVRWRGTRRRRSVRTRRRWQVPDRPVPAVGAILLRIIVHLGLTRLCRRRAKLLVRWIGRGTWYYLLCRLFWIHRCLIRARCLVLKQFCVTVRPVYQICR